MANQPEEDKDDVLSGEEFVEKHSNDEDASEDNFTEIIALAQHQHGPIKSVEDDDDDGGSNWDSLHDLRGRFNVRDDFANLHLFSQANGHLSVYEMAVREDELRGNEAQVFRDIDAETSRSKIDDRWREVRSFAGLEDSNESAPTAPEAKDRLQKLLDVRTESQKGLTPVSAVLESVQSRYQSETETADRKTANA